MAYLLDYHLEVALQHGWKTYTTNANAFNELFPGVEAATLAVWRAAVAARPLAIVPQFKRGTDKFPLIWIHAEGEDGLEQPLGDIYGTNQGHPMSAVLANQTATISVLAPTPILVRCWYGIVRAILHTQMPHMLRLYNDLRFTSADEMTTDEEEIGEQYGLAGVTARHLRVIAAVQEHYTHWDETTTAKPYYVLSSDQQTVDGNPGGVVPFDP